MNVQHISKRNKQQNSTKKHICLYFQLFNMFCLGSRAGPPRCPRAPKRSKKPSAFNPTVPSQTGPKGPEGALGPWPLAPGPLVPWPFGPLALWSLGPLVPSCFGPVVKTRSDITTERKYDGATVRRSEFIGSAGMRASVKNLLKIRRPSVYRGNGRVRPP